jgi:hypothetical protein
VRIGLTRVMFPFFAGVLLMRLGKRIKVPNAFAACSLLLIVALSLPRFGGKALWINGLYEAAVRDPAVSADRGHRGRREGRRTARRCGSPGSSATCPIRSTSPTIR